jgi:EAL domain-containing protein (putative c-di-GMP-specific phosphodiesterase class I)
MVIENLSFLVAEDHGFQRSALVKILSSMGATAVHQAPDGYAALKIIHDPNHSVDVVISDLEMPGMDGMEFIRHLGEAKRGISIVLASALDRKLVSSVATMTEAYGVTLLGVVEKPITSAKLEPLLRRHRPAPAQPERPRAAGPTFTPAEIAAGLKNGEFEPFYQPKTALAKGTVKGAEALARWRHPRHGIVAPYAFIKPLEDNGLIDLLTWLMLRKSAEFCREWRATGFDVTVSVNLSLKSLGDPQLADRVTSLVRGQQLEPRHMVLEITESSAATDLGNALENLARLRMKGFGLSIDDYGTGYSSMQQLTRVAFSELKIDQSFVANAARQESARVILQSSLDMAKKLNIAAVAEGVETQQDWNLLRELGCDQAQGYYIARPMPASELVDWTRKWSARQIGA